MLLGQVEQIDHLPDAALLSMPLDERLPDLIKARRAQPGLPLLLQRFRIPSNCLAYGTGHPGSVRDPGTGAGAGDNACAGLASPLCHSSIRLCLFLGDVGSGCCCFYRSVVRCSCSFSISRAQSPLQIWANSLVQIGKCLRNSRAPKDLPQYWQSLSSLGRPVLCMKMEFQFRGFS